MGGRGGAGHIHYPDDDMGGGAVDPPSKMEKERSGWRSVLAPQRGHPPQTFWTYLNLAKTISEEGHVFLLLKLAPTPLPLLANIGKLATCCTKR